MRRPNDAARIERAFATIADAVHAKHTEALQDQASQLQQQEFVFNKDARLEDVRYRDSQARVAQDNFIKGYDLTKTAADDAHTAATIKAGENPVLLGDQAKRMFPLLFKLHKIDGTTPIQFSVAEGMQKDYYDILESQAHANYYNKSADQIKGFELAQDIKEKQGSLRVALGELSSKAVVPASPEETGMPKEPYNPFSHIAFLNVHGRPAPDTMLQLFKAFASARGLVDPELIKYRDSVSTATSKADSINTVRYDSMLDLTQQAIDKLKEANVGAVPTDRTTISALGPLVARLQRFPQFASDPKAADMIDQLNTYVENSKVADKEDTQTEAIRQKLLGIRMNALNQGVKKGLEGKELTQFGFDYMNSLDALDAQSPGQ